MLLLRSDIFISKIVHVEGYFTNTDELPHHMMIEADGFALCLVSLRLKVNRKNIASKHNRFSWLLWYL